MTFTRYFYIFACLTSFSAPTYVFANTNTEIFEEQEIAISPSGEMLAAQWFDSVSLFNLKTGEKLYQFNAETEDPFVLTFSPDSSKLMSSGWEKLSIWNTVEGKLHARIPTAENVECGGFSNDQKTLYFDDTYSQFGHKQLTLTNGSLSKKKRILKDSARCNISPDQSLLAIQTYNFEDNGLTLKSSDIQVINLNTASTQNSLTGDQANAYDEDMFFFDENRKLLVRDFSSFHIWDLEKNAVIRTWDSDMDVDKISISGNTMLITADLEKRVWNLLEEPSVKEELPLPKTHTNVLDATLSNNGNLYTITSLDEKEHTALVSTFETKTNLLKHQIETQNPIYGAEFTKDDSLLVLESYPILVIDVTTGKIVQQLAAPKKYQ